MDRNAMVRYTLCGRVLIVLLACWMAGAAASAPLRLGTNVWPGYEPLYLARALGHLPEGEVKLVQFRSTTQVMNALRTASIEAGAVTLDEAVSLAAGGVDLTIVQVVDMSSGADVVVAHGGITTIQELAGKRIGVENTALGAYVLLRALELSGLTLAQVSVISLEPGGQLVAMKEQRADAVVCFEPIRGELLRDGCVELFNSTRIPGEIVDVIAVRTEVLNEFRPALLRIQSAWRDALKYIGESPEAAHEIMGHRLGLDVEKTKQTFQGLTLLDSQESMRLLAPGGPASETMVRLRDYMVRQNLINGEQLPRIDATASSVGEEG